MAGEKIMEIHQRCTSTVVVRGGIFRLGIYATVTTRPYLSKDTLVLSPDSVTPEPGDCNNLIFAVLKPCMLYS